MNMKKRVSVFYIPESFPCGPSSSCCGPIGLSKEVLDDLKKEIEFELGVEVDPVDVTKEEEMKKHGPVVSILNSFGIGALPIITLGEEIVSLGTPSGAQAVNAIRGKMTHSEGGN